MSEPIRLELTGRNAEQFHRIFEKLSAVIMNGMMLFIDDEDEEAKNATQETVSDLADIAKNWVKAKLDRPGLENERIAVEIVEKFEEIKLKQAQRKSVELDNESKSLDLMTKRVETAIKLLGMLSNNFVYENGKLTLLLTNQNLATLHADMKALSQEPEGTI